VSQVMTKIFEEIREGRGRGEMKEEGRKRI
jgi:hypothetical protein